MVKVVMGLALVSMLVAALAGNVAAQEAPEPAVKQGWVEKTFDFSTPDLDFKTLMPAGAKVETVPMKTRQGDALGRVVIIGEVLPVPAAEVPIRVTVLGYDLRTSGSAERICDWVLSQENYKKVEEHISPHRSGASVIGLKYDGDVPVAGVISSCLMRGFRAMAVNLLFDLPKEKTSEERDAIFDFATDYAQTFFDNVTFKNGQNDGYRDGLKDIPLTLDGKMIDVAVPEDWQVPINDFDGRANGELHILKQEGGVSKGGVWLLASDMKDKPDLAQIGGKMIPFVLGVQFKQRDALELKREEAGPPVDGKAMVRHRFLFSVTGKNGEASGDAYAIMIWNEGRLYTLIRWSPFIQDGSSNAFFSDLPMLSIYDSVAAVLNKIVNDKS